ncbi:MAG TPA: nucleotidyltransferase family protein [Candidatus Paceibacterota bacterium]|nr:nucleotidyltransferase family protein [Candidatus Paceibacterota bacterium]
MKGVILAGGNGTRLRPVTFEIPKPLITIKKKPLINYNLDLLTAAHVDDVKVIIRPQDDPDYKRWLREYAPHYPSMNIELILESEPMGTLGYVFHHLQSWIGKDDVFVVNGDVIHKGVDVKAMLKHHGTIGMPATIALIKVDRPDDYGTAVLDGHTITEFAEKKKGLPAGLVNAGLYMITNKALKHIAEAGVTGPKYLMFEKEMFPVLANSKKLGGFVADGGMFYDCGTFERWEKAINEV